MCQMGYTRAPGPKSQVDAAKQSSRQFISTHLIKNKGWTETFQRLTNPRQGAEVGEKLLSPRPFMFNDLRQIFARKHPLQWTVL